MRYLIILLALAGCIEKKEVKCRVVGQNTTSDKFGYAYYHTICECEDGYIRDVEGLDTYILPVGTEFKTKVWK